MKIHEPAGYVDKKNAPKRARTVKTTSPTKRGVKVFSENNTNSSSKPPVNNAPGPLLKFVRKEFVPNRADALAAPDVAKRGKKKSTQI